MDGANATFAVNYECLRNRVDAPVMLGHHGVAQNHAIVDLRLFHVGLDDAPTIVIHGNTHDRKTLIAIFLFELNQHRNFRAARPAPSGPEVKQDDFALEIGQFQRIASGVLQRKVWRCIAFFDRLEAF